MLSLWLSSVSAQNPFWLPLQKQCLKQYKAREASDKAWVHYNQVELHVMKALEMSWTSLICPPWHYTRKSHTERHVPTQWLYMASVTKQRKHALKRNKQTKAKQIRSSILFSENVKGDVHAKLCRSQYPLVFGRGSFPYRQASLHSHFQLSFISFL